ncbi:Hypothetical predicted protein [Pelobates cultripes]|uniref:Uncharacterized protein n=1 Tax=Pelobates cultripes TaxID=61616 RepID=A0AAD1WNB2_PELCU|nr:Hypothetical predicted protein [Pelobates cultripes]
MSDTISHFITNAIMASNCNPEVSRPKASENKPIAQGGRKATAKTHHVGVHASKTDFTDRLHPVNIEVVGPPRKRATRQAKAAQTWKRAKALTDSSDSDSEEVLDESDEIGFNESEVSSPCQSPTRKASITTVESADTYAILCRTRGRQNGSRPNM